jgi:hypothetical protein
VGLAWQHLAEAASWFDWIEQCPEEKCTNFFGLNKRSFEENIM